MEDVVEGVYYLIWDGEYFASCQYWPCMEDSGYGVWFDGDTFYDHNRIFTLPAELPL